MIHPTALVDSLAQIDSSAEIGAYVIIEGQVKIHAGVKVEPHAQIIGDTTIGEGTRIGRAALIGGEPQDLSFDPATESSVVIGKNNVIREFVTIHRGSKSGYVTRVGDNNFIMGNAHFAHDVQVGNRNVVANAALLAGHVQVGSNSFIGGSAVFHQFVRIGDYCIIQGNGSFGKDIPHYCCAQRVNRITGLNVIGLRRAGFGTADRAAMKKAFDLLFRSGLNLSQALEQAALESWPEAGARLIEFVKAPSKKGICPVQRSSSAEGEDE
jgi:UDP-N-acetylglucosamine acyltransferase